MQILGKLKSSENCLLSRLMGKNSSFVYPLQYKAMFKYVFTTCIMFIWKHLIRFDLSNIGKLKHMIQQK